MDDPIAADRSITAGHTMKWEYDAVGNKKKERAEKESVLKIDIISANE